MTDYNQWLVQAWTQQLYREYNNILFQYRVKLRPPVLCIEERSSRWGEWDPTRRVITLSKALIERYSWDVVIEVLKHEMAHQLVTELEGHDHRHGPSFLAACKKLGVAAWAARATGDLPESVPSWRDRSLSEEEERLLKKAEKLLALAGSSNEHEALLAMQKVRELYARYNLERLRDYKEDEKVCLVLGRKRKRIEASESVIFSILAEHFFVQVIFCELFDAPSLERYKTAEVFGTRQNVLMAEYVYHFLWRKIHELWNDYQDMTGKQARSKKSYMLGVLSGFRKKLAESQDDGATAAAAQMSRSEGSALTVMARKDLDAFIKERHPRLVSRKGGGGYHDSSAYSAGLEDGRSIVLNKGISSSGGNRGLLLKA